MKDQVWCSTLKMPAACRDDVFFGSMWLWHFQIFKRFKEIAPTSQAGVWLRHEQHQLTQRPVQGEFLQGWPVWMACRGHRKASTW